MTIDSNIVIAYLAGDQEVIKALLQWRSEGKPLFLSTVAESEVLSFSGFSLAEKDKTERFLKENFTSIAFDRPVAHISADVRRKIKIKFPDAAIAATAIFTRSPVVTRNVQDFKRITGLKIVTI